MSVQEAVPVISDPAGAGGDPVDILIVDDEPGNRETLADIFLEMGYRPDTAATGQEALEMVRERFYNVAILDIRLPDMNGTDLLTQIKELRPDTTCIMVTGYASLQTSMKATNAGAYAYIIKPIDVDHVSTVLRQALEKQRLQFDNDRLLRQFQALSEVTDTALLLQRLQDVLQSLLRRLISAMSADAGAILLLDDRGERLEVRASEGQEGPGSHAGLFLGEQFADQLALRQGPIVIEGTQSVNDAVASYLRERGVRSALGAPLRVQERQIGLVYVESRGPQPFDQEKVDLFHVLVTRSALLIENARLYEQERRLHREAEQMAERYRTLAAEVSTLYEVSQALVEQMRLEERLETLAGHLVRAIQVDRCIIWLFERNGLEPAAIIGAPPADAETWSRARIEPEQFGPLLQKAIERNQVVAVRDAPADGLIGSDLATQWGLRSVLMLPLVSSGRPIGVAWLDQPGELREFTDAQKKLAEAVAGLASVAIENAQTFEQKQSIASTLQQSFLPRATVRIDGFDIQEKYEPAFTAAQVGGDYYDFIELEDGKLGVVMGDVCGKGVTAAVFTAMAKYELRAYAVEDPAPSSVITRLNRSLYSQMSEDCMFITMVYGVLDTTSGDFTYVNAAHPHPLVYQPEDNTVVELPTTGGMVGAMPNMQFEEGRTRLDPGSVLLLYTDGVTEARTGYEMLESQGVKEVLRRTATGSARAICETVFRRALEFSGGNLKDDVAIVAIRRETRGD